MAGQKPSWKLRRRAVFGSLLFAGAIIVYVLARWDDTSLAQTAVLGAFGLIGAIVASYIGGAVYEDTRLKNLGEMPIIPPTQVSESPDTEYTGME
jgi:uncharacterized membrane protein